MVLRLLSKGKLFLWIISLMIIVSLICTYINNVPENNETSVGRCMSELTSIKYQLNVVTEYKNRIDRLLTETQKAHEADKERFKDVMESCIAMKQQTVICQSQFEDLQGECKKVKEDFDKLRTDIEKPKAV
ncbi:unnamed protein product [Parnassius apollo]|uniref:(apollo) hypothetical protein n=1 Tax=Parnassius apollo TaxID=110799 RepID=A0A8S3WIY1_PARAO|nr:unnamed protein product [Parnassius apollo]